MATNNKNNLRIGIDIGTSKVVCIIAEKNDERLTKSRKGKVILVSKIVSSNFSLFCI